MPRKTRAARGAQDENPRTSMRPRLDAAENRRRAASHAPDTETSMRPRLDAAENLIPSFTNICTCSNFNEAAARCRGKREARRHRRRYTRTSMRPRLDAAENASHSAYFSAAAFDFNEAAARCRGKRDALELVAEAGPDTSMRPRLDAAENESTGAGLAHIATTSMRPRLDAAENAR